MLAIKVYDRKVTFSVKVIPRSARNVAAGLYGNSLKIKLTAPPADGAANRMCVAFLSDALDVAKSEIDIITGKNARRKTICIFCPSPIAARQTAERIRSLAGVSD